jgi:two-component system NtrC family sensor kinase
VNQMEEQKLAELDPGRRLRDYLQVIHEEAFRCKAITQNLLGYARPRALRLQPTDLREVVASALSLEQARLEAQGVTPVTHFPATAPEAMADPDRLRQVLLNLIKNAADAMPEGGRLTVAIAQEGDEVVIRISDEGCGIPAEHLPRVFDPFFSTKAEGRGTGLGLSLCQQMMQKHGGRIAVESEVGAGTTFRLYLPCGRAASKDQRW